MTPQSSHTKRKLNSLLISLCFHALLCLFFIYWVTAPKKNSDHFGLRPPHKGPAQVSFQRFSPPPAPLSHQSTLQSAPKALPYLQPSKKVLTPVQSKDHQPKQRALSQKKSIEKKEKSLKKEYVSSLPSHTISPEESQKKISLPTGSYNEEASSKSSHPSLAQEERASSSSMEGSEETSRKRRITGAALMNAFKRSFYDEQSFERAAQTQSYEEETGHGTIPAHVTERLREWDYSSYQKKISQALIRATKMHKKYITVPVSVQERLSFKLIINKEGILRAEPLQPLTGIEEIDKYVNQFFALVETPPLPKRFNLDEFVAHVTIQLTLSQGGHFLQLKPLIE